MSGTPRPLTIAEEVAALPGCEATKRRVLAILKAHAARVPTGARALDRAEARKRHTSAARRLLEERHTTTEAAHILRERFALSIRTAQRIVMFARQEVARPMRRSDL